MTEIQCGDAARVAAFVYGECEASEQAAMERHLASCPACAAEVDGLRATREHLAAWVPPDARLGFQIVAQNEEAPPLVERGRPLAFEPVARRGAWRWSPIPAWAQAAAAVLLFAVGGVAAALMNIEVRYDASGVTVRTGWQRAPVAAATAPAVADLESGVRQVLAKVEGERAQSASAPVASAASTAGTPSPAVLQRVTEIVEASERRQQRELALRITQVLRDVERQRTVDIAGFERSVRPVETMTNELQQHSRALDYLIKVSEGK